jgi:mRNA interferase RelE/StbE
MSSVQWEESAKRSFARLRKDDRSAADQLLDSINLLARNPRPAGAQRYGADRLRIHVGFYRIMYRVVSEKPVIIAIEHIGRRR